MNARTGAAFVFSLFIAFGFVPNGFKEAHAITTIASGADDYSRPRLNNNDEIVWRQTNDDRATVWSNKRGQISFNTTNIFDNDPDINDAGEIIWSFGGDPGPHGIESNIRGVIYYGVDYGLDPYTDSHRINNNGEIIWTKVLYPDYNAEEIWSSERGRLTYSPEYTLNREPAINDSGEVVYKTYFIQTEISNIASTERGAITDDSLAELEPDINNTGEVVWVQSTNKGWEIWSNVTGRITDNETEDRLPSINDEGEIVWQSWDGHDYEIVSNIRGQITDNDVSDTAPQINNLGTVVWKSNNEVVAIYSVSAITVVIDVKPGNDWNGVNPREKGNIWVAILSDTDPNSPFDPSSQVDIPTVAFGPDGANATRHKVKDINKDGLGDLLLRFRIPATGISCGDTEATLTGETFNGLSITGTDSIKTIGCKPKKDKKKKHSGK